MKKKNAFALIALALLLVALMAGCRRAKPAVVSNVEVTPTTAAAVATGRTVVPVASSTPTPEGTPETTPSGVGVIVYGYKFRPVMEAGK